MKKTKGTYDPNSPRIGFHNWNLDTFSEGAKELFEAAFKEALDLATAEYPCHAMFGIDNVLHIRVELPLGAEEYDDPAWTFSMDEMVDDVILLEDSKEYIAAIRDELRRLADILDERIAKASLK